MPTASRPGQAARNLVATALVAAESAAAREVRAAQDIERSLQRIKANLIKDAPWYKPRSSISDADIRAAALSDQDYLRLQEAHRLAVSANYAAHNAAILETVKAYNLFPPVMDFTGDPRAAGVNMVTKPWLPRYSRHEKRDEKTGRWRLRTPKELASENAQNSVVGGGVTAARTRGNGVMELYGQVFASPEDLALLIYHETSHWVDTAGRSGGFTRKDPPAVSFRTEQHAYERTATFAATIGADPAPHLARARQFKLQAEISEAENLTKAQVLTDPRFRSWIGKDWEGALALAPAEPEIAPGDEELLGRSMHQAQKDAREAREYQELLEYARRQAESMPTPIDPRPTGADGLPLGHAKAVPTIPGAGDPVAARPTRMALWPQLIKLISTNACASPPRPVERELAAMDWGALQSAPEAGALADALSGCERRVALRLIELGRAWRPGSVIGPAAVLEAAADPVSAPSSSGGVVPPNQNHDPVWGKVGPIIRR